MSYQRLLRKFQKRAPASQSGSPHPSGQAATQKPNKLCEQCTKINILELLQSEKPPYSWWYEPEPAKADQRHAPNEQIADVVSRAFNLGYGSSIKFQDYCSLCKILKSCIPDLASSSEDEFFIVPAWGIERVEPSISIWWRDYRHPKDGSKGGLIDYAKVLYVARKDKHGKHQWTFPHDVLDALSICGTAPVMGGRKVGEKVDFNMMAQWVDQCLQNHSETCKIHQDAGLKTMRLIDVHTREVINHPEGAEYLCLSYVWGQVRQESRSLGELPALLPAVIEDAIAVVLGLGKQYLWVDSICIEQDKEEHKESQIGLMGSIYRGAWATLVALSGTSANSGLGRINPKIPSIPQVVYDIGDASIVSLMPTLQQQIDNSMWAKRGWTLQEGQLSPRCLYFTPHQVYFECKATQCCETIQEPSSPVHSWANKRRLISRYDKSPQDAISPGVFSSAFSLKGQIGETTTLALYDEYIREYLSRSLTNASDAVNAINGLLTQLQRDCRPHFNSGFFCGLPVDALPFALMWFATSPSRRRPQFPTWSWAGWEGPLKRIVVIPKDSQHGPHDSHQQELQWFPKDATDRLYFIQFKQVGDDGALKTIYQADPTDDPKFNQYEWGSQDRITNSAYIQYAAGCSDITEIPRNSFSFLFIEGLLFRPNFSALNLQADNKSPAEEHTFLLSINDITCWLTCYTESIAKEIRDKGEITQHLLVLHREFHDYVWFYDLLLLEWKEDVAYRVGPLKLRVQTSTRLEVFREFRPVRGCFALG